MNFISLTNIIVAGFLSNLEDGTDKYFMEKFGHLRIPIIIQATSIFRVMEWNSGLAKEVLERNYNTILDNTLQMLDKKEIEDEVLGPEHALVVALLLAEGSKHQPKGQIFEVVEKETIGKAKLVIKRYIENFK